MQCSKCKIENEKGSKYCKRCGNKLELGPSHTPVEVAQIGELIYAAYKHQDAGRLDDAIAACQGALVLNPGNASAHTLLGSLFDQKGDQESALYEYEKAATLEPDNQADRDRYEDLRNELDAQKLVSSYNPWLEKLRPYTPHIAAAGSLIVVLIVGMVLMASPARKFAKSAQGIPQQQQAGAGFHGTSVGDMPDGQSNASDVQQVSQENQAQEGAQPAAAQQKIVQQPQSDQTESVPATPRKVIQSPPPEQPSAPPFVAPAIEPVQRPTRTPTSVPVITPVENTETQPPVITAAATSHVDPEKRAMQLQGQGRYGEAVSSYEDALPQSHDRGGVYQQIGLCYQRLGERQMAIDSYNKAIQAFKSQSVAGRDQADVDRNIKACQRAIQANR